MAEFFLHFYIQLCPQKIAALGQITRNKGYRRVKSLREKSADSVPLNVHLVWNTLMNVMFGLLL